MINKGIIPNAVKGKGQRETGKRVVQLHISGELCNGKGHTKKQ
jgi:hypothetical protein